MDVTCLAQGQHVEARYLEFFFRLSGQQTSRQTSAAVILG